MTDYPTLDIPVPSLPLALIPFVWTIALLGWLSERTGPEAPAGSSVAEQQA